MVRGPSASRLLLCVALSASLLLQARAFRVCGEIPRLTRRPSSAAGRAAPIVGASTGDPSSSDSIEEDSGVVRVVAAPTYEEMLRWAACVDREREEDTGDRVDTLQESADSTNWDAADDLLDSWKAMYETLNGVDETLEPTTAAALRAGLAHMRQSIDRERTENASLGVGSYSAYGSREVRDKIYLYVWSILRRKAQERDEKDEQNEQK